METALDQTTRARIRHIFLSPRPSFALLQASDLLGMTLEELKREVEDGAIVAGSTRLGVRVTREEMIAAAMRRYAQAIIEEALGALAEQLLPEAIRLVELRARVPPYQRDVLRYLAQKDGTSVDAVLARELEDVASAHAEELVGAVPGFAIAIVWPETPGEAVSGPR
jgi:hypothetical protein